MLFSLVSRDDRGESSGRAERREGLLGASVGRSLIASVREAGVGCPHCAVDVAVGDPVVVCQACGTVHHESCWERPGRLRLVLLRPARRPEIAANRSEPVLLITAAELDRAIPMRVAGLPHRAAAGRRRSARTAGSAAGPPRRPAGARTGSRPAGWRSPRWSAPSRASPSSASSPDWSPCCWPSSRWAASAAAPAAGSGWPLPGLLLGIVDVAGWAYLLVGGPLAAPVTPDELFSDPPPDLAAIQELDPPLQRAMRANVLIERPARAGDPGRQGDRLGGDPPDRRGARP